MRLDVDAESLVRGAEQIEEASREYDHRRSEVALDAGDEDLTRALGRFGSRWSEAGRVLHVGATEIVEGLRSASRAYHAADAELARVAAEAGATRSRGVR